MRGPRWQFCGPVEVTGESTQACLQPEDSMCILLQSEAWEFSFWRERHIMKIEMVPHLDFLIDSLSIFKRIIEPSQLWNKRVSVREAWGAPGLNTNDPWSLSCDVKRPEVVLVFPYWCPFMSTVSSGRMWFWQQVQHHRGCISPRTGACYPELRVLSPARWGLFLQTQPCPPRFHLGCRVPSGFRIPRWLVREGLLKYLSGWEELIAQGLHSKSEKHQDDPIIILLKGQVSSPNPLLWY